jgi:general secretion pathway protein G
VKAMRKKNNRGFTLIELLIVMIILGLIASLVAPKMFNKVSSAKTGTARSQIELLGTALDAYRLDNGAYPTTAQGMGALRESVQGLETWDGPYLPKPVPDDPWNRPYMYKSPGDHGDYDLYTYGRDGQAGGEDEDEDVVSWEN